VEATRLRRLLGLVLAVVLVALVAGCATSPTGRSQLILFSDGELDQMGAASFEHQKQQVPLAQSARTNRYVECVAEAIVAELEPAQRTGWEVRVFESGDVNAFALPGRKIGVYTGLLQVAKSQDQLAAVIGHEVGHVLARHGNERVSQQAAVQAGAAAVSAVVAASDMSSTTGQMVMAGLGMGAQYGVLLPYSRTHETEADTIGIDLMARAGFDPRQSVELWRNMAALGGESPPELASTHPSNESRIANLEKHLADAERTADEAHRAGRVPRCAP
jgi:predicted Zn-dependent protease